jgi:transposase-like protein
MSLMDWFRGKRVKDMSDEPAFEHSVKYDGVHITQHERIMLETMHTCPDCGAHSKFAVDRDIEHYFCTECRATFTFASEYMAVRGIFMSVKS